MPLSRRPGGHSQQPLPVAGKQPGRARGHSYHGTVAARPDKANTARQAASPCSGACAEMSLAAGWKRSLQPLLWHCLLLSPAAHQLQPNEWPGRAMLTALPRLQTGLWSLPSLGVALGSPQGITIARCGRHLSTKQPLRCSEGFGCCKPSPVPEDTARAGGEEAGLPIAQGR